MWTEIDSKNNHWNLERKPEPRFQNWQLKARAEAKAQLGEAGIKSDKEFGMEYSDAFLLAVKEAQPGVVLSVKEKAELKAYRKFMELDLNPSEVKSAVYLDLKSQGFFGKETNGRRLTEAQSTYLKNLSAKPISS